MPQLSELDVASLVSGALKKTVGAPKEYWGLTLDTNIQSIGGARVRALLKSKLLQKQNPPQIERDARTENGFRDHLLFPTEALRSGFLDSFLQFAQDHDARLQRSLPTCNWHLRYRNESIIRNTEIVLDHYGQSTPDFLCQVMASRADECKANRDYVASFEKSIKEFPYHFFVEKIAKALYSMVDIDSELGTRKLIRALFIAPLEQLPQMAPKALICESLFFRKLDPLLLQKESLHVCKTLTEGQHSMALDRLYLTEAAQGDVIYRSRMAAEINSAYRSVLEDPMFKAQKWESWKQKCRKSVDRLYGDITPSEDALEATLSSVKLSRLADLPGFSAKQLLAAIQGNSEQPGRYRHVLFEALLDYATQLWAHQCAIHLNDQTHAISEKLTLNDAGRTNHRLFAAAIAEMNPMRTPPEPELTTKKAA